MSQVLTGKKTEKGKKPENMFSPAEHIAEALVLLGWMLPGEFHELDPQ